MGGRGSGGHNKKPSTLRETQGNAGHRPLNKKEPTPAPADAEIPGELIGVECDFWRRIFPIVSDMRVMTSADVFALTQLCRFLAEEHECTVKIREQGRLLPKKNNKGVVIAAVLNPLVRLRSDAARHVRSYLAVFGLGPSFRSSISAEKPQSDQPQDPLDKIFGRDDSTDIVH